MILARMTREKGRKGPRDKNRRGEEWGEAGGRDKTDKTGNEKLTKEAIEEGKERGHVRNAPLNPRDLTNPRKQVDGTSPSISFLPFPPCYDPAMYLKYLLMLLE